MPNAPKIRPFLTGLVTLWRALRSDGRFFVPPRVVVRPAFVPKGAPRLYGGLVLLAVMVVFAPVDRSFAADKSEILEKIRSQLDVADGFDLAVFAQVPNARSMAVAADLGGIFVGTRGRNLYFVTDPVKAGTDGAGGTAGTVTLISSDFTSANGVAYKPGTLFVADQDRLVSFDMTAFTGTKLGKPDRVLFAGLPDKSHHGWRYIALSPDGETLFVAVGAPCNICKVSGLEGTIITLPVTGGEPEIYASGIRNSVGLTFHPDSGDLWFTDNGGDGLGDDVPREELNHAVQAGGFYGYPWFAGDKTRAPDFKNETIPHKVTFPAFTFNAHNAPLGVHFYNGDALVALHGSWNRTVPDGYKVVRVKFTDGQPVSASPFLAGFLRSNGAVLGRPVDIKSYGKDGGVLVSDDHGGVIWRLTPRS
jgi:glucose/arabinose dehydrogenase